LSVNFSEILFAKLRETMLPVFSNTNLWSVGSKALTIIEASGSNFFSFHRSTENLI
jgi:hypothetical protein